MATNSGLWANFFHGGAGSSFLGFTALQLRQVLLLMYPSGRSNTSAFARALRRGRRAAHIQCWSSSTSGLRLWSPAKPCQPSKRRDHFRFCRPRHDGRKCFRSSQSLSVPLAAAQSLFSLSPSDGERVGVRGHARPCRQPPKPASRLPSSISHPSCILSSESSESFSCILYTECSESWTAAPLARIVDT